LFSLWGCRNRIEGLREGREGQVEIVTKEYIEKFVQVGALSKLEGRDFASVPQVIGILAE
jgi:hypothetical protein